MACTKDTKQKRYIVPFVLTPFSVIVGAAGRGLDFVVKI